MGLLIGPRTLEQLEDNLKALQIELTEEDRRNVDEIIPPGRMVSPFFETDTAPQSYR